MNPCTDLIRVFHVEDSVVGGEFDAQVVRHRHSNKFNLKPVTD